MYLNKFVGLAAVGVTSFGGAASAATVDVMYKFNTAYGINCEFNETCNKFEQGDFEIGFSYDNVTVDKLDSYAEGFDAFRLDYMGETIAQINTPVGLISFQAVGRGSQQVDFNDEGAFVRLSEDLASVSEPTSNFLQMYGVYNFREAQTSAESGIRGFSFGSGDQFDVPLFFRFEKEDGTFITGGSAAFDAELTITVSGESAVVPSPVPLPATLPLLAVALGSLGFGARRLKTRSKAS